MAIESVPRTSLEDLLAESPHSRGTSINSLWRNSGSISGPLSLLVDAGHESRLDLLEAMRLVAMSEASDVEVVAHVLENARLDPGGDASALHSAATFVVTRPEMMRWVSANAARVAASPNWMATIPGLGGTVVSVPLAEEALGHLVAAKARLPKEMTRFVQLNPWFTRRFAIQYRRYAGGRRIRFPDRAETARAWSHARALLGPQLPPEWHSRHSRGGGRAIDQWSHRFLVRYAALLAKVYRTDGIPPTMAALFVIASAADVSKPPTAGAVAGWSVLPASIEREALNLIGIGPSPGSGLEPAAEKDTGAFVLKASRSMIPKISWR